MVFVVVRLTGSDDDTAGGTTGQSQGPVAPSAESSSSAGSSPSTEDSPSVPRPTMAVADCLQCFPDVKISALSAKLRAKGWVCTARDDTSAECKKTNDQDTITINGGGARDKTLVSSLTLHSFSGGAGAYPQGKAQSVAKSRAELPFVVAALFSDAGVRGQVTTWLHTNVPDCGTEGTIEGYRVSCEKPSAMTVGAGTKTVTSWSIHVTFDGRRI